jgi:hypothetical protein
MSKSGVRMFTLVAVVGVGLVGALSVVGVRVSRQARRPRPASLRVVENAEAPAPVVRARHDYDQPAHAGESAGQGAMLPSIAADVAREAARQGSREGVGVAPGEGQRRLRHGDPTLEGYREPDPRQRVLKQQLESVLAHHPSVELAFVNCDQPDCRARAEARDLISLKSFIKDASALASSMKIHVETHTSAFNGTSYRVDLEGPPPPASAAVPSPGG